MTKSAADIAANAIARAVLSGPVENTDRELWREPDEGNGSHYADSIFVTEYGGIGINCGGYVIVMPLHKWFALARPKSLALKPE